MSLTDSATSPTPSYDLTTPDPVGTRWPQRSHTAALRDVLEIDLQMRHAGQRRVRIAYECKGQTAAPALVLAGGISADRHALASRAFPEAGWWQSQAASFREDAHCIICIDWLGADGEIDAPIDSADQADAIAAVLEHLGVAQLQAFVGCSYGAMVGLQFAALHPHRLKQLVAISGTHRAHPYSSAWRALQRRAVALGALQCDNPAGLALARELAMLSYRTPKEFAQRFDAAPRVVEGRVRCAAEDYLEHCGNAYVARVHAQGFLRLSESIDLHRVDPARIRVPTTVVAVAEDRIVPLGDACALVRALPRADCRILHSCYGHDAFLKETRAIGDVLHRVLHQSEVAA